MSPPASAVPGPRRSLDRLIAPRSIAIVGASSDPIRIGGRPLARLIERGFAGGIYPVNPTRPDVQGVKAYASVLDIDGEVDCAILALPAEAVVDAARQCAAKKVGAVIVFSAGFAEAGPEGVALQNQLSALARETGMRIMGPNCMGMFNLSDAAFMTFAGWVPQAVSPRFNLGVVSQSGGYGTHILRMGDRRGLNISHWITTGNECDVEAGELIGELARRSEVSAIFVYLEGIRSRENFIASLELARSRRVPVIVVKAGHTDIGAAAAASHTASLVGSDDIYEAVFREYGVFRAHSTEEALDVAYALSRGILPTDPRVAVFSLSGGVGVQIADYMGEEGLELPALSEPVQAAIKVLSPQAATRNPIDITAQFMNDPPMVDKTLDLILGTEKYTTVLSFLSTVGLVPSIAATMIESLRGVAKRYPDRLHIVSIVGTPEIVAEMEAMGCLLFEEPQRAVRALGALVRFAQAFDRPAAEVTAHAPAARLQAGQRFNEHQAKALLQACGIQIPGEQVCATAAEAAAASKAIGFPVAVKVVSADILHKTEVGGVALGLQDAAQVSEAVTRMEASVRAHRPDARIDGYLVSRMVSGGVECVLGVKRDPVFGPVLAFGLGGIMVEVLEEVAVRLVPLNEAQALDMVRETAAWKMLQGFRGGPPGDLPALASAIAAVSRLAAENADCIETIEINPLRVMPAGQGVIALDAVVETLGGGTTS